MTQLSSSVTTTNLKTMITNSDQVGISNFILQRFSERYLNPIKRLDRTEKHGFSIMAISCLMIESLESFKNGWEDTRNKSEKAFKSFFERETEFEIFRTVSSQFYKNVRCGILHQSETTNGWKIRRDGNLFKPETKTINATDFLNKLEITLNKYVSELKSSDWDSSKWDNLRRKLRLIINNCGNN